MGIVFACDSRRRNDESGKLLFVIIHTEKQKQCCRVRLLETGRPDEIDHTFVEWYEVVVDFA